MDFWIGAEKIESHFINVPQLISGAFVLFMINSNEHKTIYAILPGRFENMGSMMSNLRVKGRYSLYVHAPRAPARG